MAGEMRLAGLVICSAKSAKLIFILDRFAKIFSLSASSTFSLDFFGLARAFDLDFPSGLWGLGGVLIMA
jgi:hypothetical protein